MKPYAQDLELARLCAAGDEAAWERFVREYRPVLYRAADALDPGGGARDLADALYGELYGVQERDGQRLSLFRYFHGKSSLATWLRAVLAQRYVDRQRAQRRLEPLPQEEDAAPYVPTPDPERSRFLILVRRAFADALARLSDRDRLRLGCYYAQELTLAQTGRVLREHEATVSRQLARTREALREDVRGQLADDFGLSHGEVERCFELAAEDPGTLDLDRTLAAAERKKSAQDRSV